MEIVKLSIRAARVNAGMSAREAAEKLDVSERTILNWEQGKVTVRRRDKIALASIYGVPRECFDE